MAQPHRALAPTIYTPADRCFGVMEIPKTFTRLTLRARWRGDTRTNHSSKRQIGTSGVIKVKSVAVEE